MVHEFLHYIFLEINELSLSNWHILLISTYKIIMSSTLFHKFITKFKYLYLFCYIWACLQKDKKIFKYQRQFFFSIKAKSKMLTHFDQYEQPTKDRAYGKHVATRRWSVAVGLHGVSHWQWRHQLQTYHVLSTGCMPRVTFSCLYLQFFIVLREKRITFFLNGKKHAGVTISFL